MTEPHLHRATPVNPRAGQRAGVVTRTIAGAIDYAMLTLAVSLGYGSIQALVFVWDPRHFEAVVIPFGLLVSAGIFLMWVYLSVSWGWRGQTIGGAVMGTRVLTRKGGRLLPPQAMLRAGFTVVFAVGLFWCALPHRRSVQDTVLLTQVVYV